MLNRSDINHMVSRQFPAIPGVGKIHEDTTEFFKVEYGDVILLEDRPFLIRHNAKEGRFGLEDEVKYWVKHAVDLLSGERKIIKLEFFEKFEANIGTLIFECFRSPKKEARILDLVAQHPNFMHGYWAKDRAGNIVRVLDYIYGKSLHTHVQDLTVRHEAYFFTDFLEIFKHYVTCVKAIDFLHQHNEKHGDIRRDHIFLDRDTHEFRWIDFDYSYLHKENIYSYDLFGLGNILVFIVGKGDILLHDLKQRKATELEYLGPKDFNIVFKNRVANLKKIYPYIPERLNRILLHFSSGAELFYENTRQLLEDLQEASADLA